MKSYESSSEHPILGNGAMDPNSSAKQKKTWNLRQLQMFFLFVFGEYPLVI